MNRRGLLKSLAGIVAGAVGIPLVKPDPLRFAGLPPIGSPYPWTHGAMTITEIKAMEFNHPGWVDIRHFGTIHRVVMGPKK